jgi:beta-1,4-mannosyl-glycoprotein beta-1,4-N-acetylglucosaminyltransferase
MQHKVYDCFTYFNEDQLLKLRLETLWDSVDYFVICEATRTHTGKEKPINFKLEVFDKYKSKIRYLLIDTYPFQTDDPWVYENYQRNYLMNGLYDAKDHDWIMVSDLDEIPNPESIGSFNPKKYLRASFHQHAFLYYLNNRVMRGLTPFIWTLPKVTTYASLKDIFKCPQEVRNYRGKGLFRGVKKFLIKQRTQDLSNGGWHFTWMGGVEKIILKMNSMAHQELNKPELQDPKLIEEKIRSGGDILGASLAGGDYELLELHRELPKYLIENPDEFRNLILDPKNPNINY